MHEENKSEKIRQVISASPVTPHNRALYETGKALLNDSVAVGRDFCKFMISLSTSGIPVYLGIIKFFNDGNQTFSVFQKVLIAVPAIIFLFASIVFAAGYYPQGTQFSLDLVDDIDRARRIIIKRRQKLSLVGFCLFLIATFLAIIAVISNL